MDNDIKEELIYDNNYISKDKKHNTNSKKNNIYCILSNIFYSLFFIQLKIYNCYFNNNFTIHNYFLWINITIFIIGIIFHAFKKQKIKEIKKNKQDKENKSYDYICFYLKNIINYFELYFLINMLKYIRLLFGVLFSNSIIVIISLLFNLYNKFLLNYLLQFILWLFMTGIFIKNEYDLKFKENIIEKEVYSTLKYSIAFCIFKIISYYFEKKLLNKNLDMYNYLFGLINSTIAFFFLFW